ncbi:SPW repeat protein [Streptomyces platensis]|uniref:Membrane protein n=1 Tax=Streptomyces glebosus TaxID=249580 RepID=A0A640T701_9ACTN|nr:MULTISPECIES: SPW repeat protein [Streptomyces]MCX4637202.1 SPW repeat protein [Streptomyces platensis]QIY54061.1 SPW repeat protein [Streptomyces sp. RPA4-5]WJY36631.1 SPW repeat protein [Streptomyces sp. P9-2B-2]WSI59355.1 SPW repeat protein [Streptomyces platensis]WSW50552.1 SPW repeat protein [Streptomyces platensis]
MADVSHHRGDLAGHPDASEMQARYDRVLGGRDVVLVDGPVLLVGLYCAVSPWILHFAGAQSALMVHNLILGVAIALMAVGFTVAPDRMYGLSGAMCAIGVWMIISPWIVGSSPDAGVIWNNIVIGALTFLLGAMCVAAASKSRRAT